MNGHWWTRLKEILFPYPTWEPDWTGKRRRARKESKTMALWLALDIALVIIVLAFLYLLEIR